MQGSLLFRRKKQGSKVESERGLSFESVKDKRLTKKTDGSSTVGREQPATRNSHPALLANHNQDMSSSFRSRTGRGRGGSVLDMFGFSKKKKYNVDDIEDFQTEENPETVRFNESAAFERNQALAKAYCNETNKKNKGREYGVSVFRNRRKGKKLFIDDSYDTLEDEGLSESGSMEAIDIDGEDNSRELTASMFTKKKVHFEVGREKLDGALASTVNDLQMFEGKVQRVDSSSIVLIDVDEISL